MPLTTRLTETLGIRHPVLLAPMGGVAGGALAGAVTAPAASASSAAAMATREWLERQFAAAGNSARRLRLHHLVAGAAAGAARRGAWRRAGGDHAVLRRSAAVRARASRQRARASSARCRASPMRAKRSTPAPTSSSRKAREAGGHGATRATLPFVPVVVDAWRGRRPKSSSSPPAASATGAAWRRR